MTSVSRPHLLRRSVAAAVLVVLVACTSSSSDLSPGPPTGTTTTTVGPTSPTASSTTPPPNGPIGYVGCSNSAAAVNGYHLDGGNRFWPFLREYGGGSVTQWEEGIGQPENQYWSAFARQQEQAPAQVFWFQLCATAFENQNDDDEARAVIAEIRRRVPDAVVYISALNGWVAPHVCGICGPKGPANMRADAADVVASGEALEGPRIPPLTAFCPTRECGISSRGATNQNNQVDVDGCHPNEKGQLMFGEALRRFFG